MRNQTLISLNDHQLTIVMNAARCLDHEKRNVFLERVAGLLRLQAGRYGDDDVCRAVDQALRSLNAINTAA
jgi:hypothetical protein